MTGKNKEVWRCATMVEKERQICPNSPSNKTLNVTKS